MFKAMALKEWRESRPVILLGLAFYALLLWFLVPLIAKQYPLTIPFMGDDFRRGYSWISAGVAMILGFRQTLGESMAGTFPFLFHRPATRRWLIGMKVAVGLLSYLLFGLFPIVAYAFWASIPGIHASPFYWEMTTPSLVAWAAMTILYLGAFLSGIRPGRWFGSRLFPLVAAALAAIFAYYNSDHDIMVSLAWTFVVDLWLIVLILYVARTRDYT